MEEMYLLLSNSSSDTIRYAKDIYIYGIVATSRKTVP
jgi:hypothetical protein